MSGALVEGNLVDVFHGTVYPARVTIMDQWVAGIEPLQGARDCFILPGLIDAHVHIESSLLCPSRFAEEALAHGTTAVVSDPHEIANVLGMEGVGYMEEEADRSPLRIYYTAPSCVPAVADQDFGSRLGWREVRQLLRSPRFVALGEMMDFAGVVRDEPEAMAKLEVAKELGKPIDGHAPGLSGPALAAYVAAGASSDHECTTAEEAREKHSLGMRIMVREGSASKDMAALMPFARSHECMLVTDDLDAADLARGHVDSLLRRAVEEGMDPIHAVRAVTIWPARHYHLPLGEVKEGGLADLTLVRDMRAFEPLRTWVGGQLLATMGKVRFHPQPKRIRSAIVPQEVRPSDLMMPHQGERALVTVQQAFADRIVGGETAMELPVRQGVVAPDLGRDVLLMAVVNRYQPRAPVLGFIHGFGLRRGALASSVSHDAHNLIGVGTDHDQLAQALAAVMAQGGGYHARDGERSSSLPLPIAGLMSDWPCREVASADEAMRLFAQKMGCPLPSPFMTLSFQDPSFRRAVMSGEALGARAARGRAGT